MEPASGAKRATDPEAPGRRWTLVAVCGATFMLLVDVTIVQVALPTIQRELQASFSDLQWVIDAYALTLATLILTWGSSSDRFGRKRIFITGLCVFTLASLLCGVATSSMFLIWARAAQGVGGAAMFATGLALIGQEFRGPAMARAIAVWAATVGAAVAVGPLVGGALTSGLGWRWIFLVNLPVGAATIALAVPTMTNVGDPAARRLDVAGLVTFSGSMFLLVLALVRGNDDGWSSPLIVSLLVAAAVLMGLFVTVELSQRYAMFDLTLFRKPGFTGVSIATFAIGAGMFAMFLYITLYLQDELGYSPFQGGIRLLPATALAFFVPLLMRSVADRLPPGAVLGAGLVVTCAGLIAMHGVTVASGWTAIALGLVVTGGGIGIANPAIARIGLGVVPPARSGMASGISNTCRIGGLATGVAALGAVFSHAATASLSRHLGHPAAGLAKALVAAGPRAVHAAGQARGAVSAASQAAFVDAFNVIVLVGAAIVAAGAVAAFALVRARDLYPAPLPVPAPQTAEPAGSPAG